MTLTEEKEEKKERAEGFGIWNKSRAPHCYGWEYEQEFGHVFKVGLVSDAHETVWRKSCHWPNVPPVRLFYPDANNYKKNCKDIFFWKGVHRARVELKERKKRKREYEIAYNVIRRTRRRKKAVENRERRETLRKEAVEKRERRETFQKKACKYMYTK